MKTNFVRQISLGLAAGLTFFLGCARPSAEQSSVAIASATPAPVVRAQGAPAANDAALAAPAADANPPAILDRIEPTVKADSVAVSPGLAEVAKLAQAGVSEEVMLAYVDKYAGSFNIGADQILYLNDLGVPSTVVTSMLKHDGNTSVTANAVPAPTAPSTPSTPVYTEATAPTVATAVAPPSASTEVSYFYDSLSPYGSWIYLSGYGWCWQPTVAVGVSSWRPYSDRGRWYWSDAGWYWNSDYSWGWAAFHYGRWYHHAGCGWVWTPGVTWAPSWVSWRYSAGYCGWAPLPPEAHFVHGGGFTYYGRHVAVGFEFGLTDYHYSFVGINNFCDYSPSRHFVSRTSVRNVYHNTTVINNYGVGNNNTVINRGVSRDTIARANSTRIREVSVRETSVQNLATVRGERLTRQGDRTVVERPQLPKNPPQVRSAQFVNRTDGQRNTGRNATVGATSGSGPTTATVRPQNNSGAEVRNSGRARENQTATQPVTQPRRVEPVVNSAPAPSGRGAGEARRQNEQPRANEARVQNSTPNPAPEVRSQPQQQQRGNRSLFGDSGARAVTPQNNVPAARTVEPRNSAPVARTQAQPNYSAPVTRSYPQATAPLQQQPRNNAPAVMSPRGVEQAPRANVPTYSAPTHSGQQSQGQGQGNGSLHTGSYSAPRENRSESRSENRQGGGGGGGGGSRSESRNDSGSGRNAPSK